MTHCSLQTVQSMQVCGINTEEIIYIHIYVMCMHVFSAHICVCVHTYIQAHVEVKG